MAHPDHITPGDVLRALRQSATLSQRELAERAGMPHSAVGRLEASRHADPRISTFARLVTASGHGLLIADAAGRLIDVHNDRRGRNADGLRDCAGRRLPAHLRLFRVVGEGDPWWGWRRIAWQTDDPGVPVVGYLRRPSRARLAAAARLAWMSSDAT